MLLANYAKRGLPGATATTASSTLTILASKVMFCRVREQQAGPQVDEVAHCERRDELGVIYALVETVIHIGS